VCNTDNLKLIICSYLCNVCNVKYLVTHQSWKLNLLFYSTAAHFAMQSAVLAIVMQNVRPSVCHTVVLYWPSAMPRRPSTVSQAWHVHTFICQSLLSLPRYNLSFGSRAFHIAAAKIWNSLRSNILECRTLASFRRHPKTRYFQSAIACPLAPMQSE